jgi:isocitrate/isopropylmalate dehydrogenase
MSGISKTLEVGQQLTRDLGGQCSTDQMGDAICANILQSGG